MEAHRFRVGQLVAARDPGALAERCPTYSIRHRHGIVVSACDRRIGVKWIDHYRGLQTDTCLVAPPLLCAGILDPAARTRIIHCRRTDTAVPGLTAIVVPPSARPDIEMRELRISSARSTETATGLKFHTVHDANVALHALADAQAIFESTFGPDLTSAVPGADIAVVCRALYTTVYRLEPSAACVSARALAG